jgi:SNF2 family DNA or RNA helicase
MGLGKTVQAVAAMSAFWKEWPLLVLCPSSARYHWEVELRHWLGESSASSTTTDSDGVSEKGFQLKKEMINVLTSGKSCIFRSDGATKVVICSYGLIVSLVYSERIFPGMFDAVIVDESHALKNKASKRTLAVLPLLKGADRCLLLSGTPALARPSELWPQLSVLGGRRKDGLDDKTSGIWIDEEGFYSKYVRGELVDDGGSKARQVCR